jgi:hypothetical protein
MMFICIGCYYFVLVNVKTMYSQISYIVLCNVFTHVNRSFFFIHVSVGLKQKNNEQWETKSLKIQIHYNVLVLHYMVDLLI